ncbi:MAG: hypothetical protein IPG50_21045 [Myxococcales bacterium]|nr:hypothetical protein [Myxococcales bacterium]
MTNQSPEESKSTVVVASHRMPESLLGDIVGACEAAGVRRFLWTGDATAAPATQLVSWLAATGAPPPALLVAWLAAGERRVPDDIVELMTRSMPTISLLLLCEEPLVRPTVTIQSGRVTLLSPPLSAGRIAARIRALTANTVSATGSLLGAGPADARHGPVRTSERQHANGWVGAMTCGGDTPSDSLPLVVQGTTEGLTALLRVDPGAPLLVDAEAARVADAMRREEPDDEKERKLRDMLGGSYAALHLAPDGEDWIVYWPAGPEVPLRILSPMRLPNAYNLSNAFGKTGSLMMRFGAASGDVVVALTGASGAEDDIAKAVAEGGPAVLDLLTGRLRQGPRKVSGIVAEVR